MFFAIMWAGAAALAAVCAAIVWRLRLILGRWSLPIIIGLALLLTPLFYQLLIIAAVFAVCYFWHSCI